MLLSQHSYFFIILGCVDENFLLYFVEIEKREERKVKDLGEVFTKKNSQDA